MRLGVVECNEEQINLFASEISGRLDVSVCPILLAELETPCDRSAKMLAQIDYFATTHFHFKEVQGLTAKYRKKLVRLRLNAAFMPQIVAAAGEGPVLMVVSSTSYFPAFRRRLLDIGTPPERVERIIAVNHRDLHGLRAAMTQARAVHVSSICDARVRKMIPSNVKELKFDNILAPESIEMLEAVMLFHPQQQSSSKRKNPHKRNNLSFKSDRSIDPERSRC